MTEVPAGSVTAISPNGKYADVLLPRMLWDALWLELDRGRGDAARSFAISRICVEYSAVTSDRSERSALLPGDTFQVLSAQLKEVPLQVECFLRRVPRILGRP